MTQSLMQECSMNFVSEVHIISYFSLPTDLASEMKRWPEYVEGKEYSVRLNSPDTAETVEVALVERDDEEPPYVYVRSTTGKALFERVLGTVTYALAAHSDNLMIYRWDPKAREQ